MTVQELRDRARGTLPAPCGCGDRQAERALVGALSILRCANCGGAVREGSGTATRLHGRARGQQLGSYNEVPA
jgi:hypothetical protein